MVVLYYIMEIEGEMMSGGRVKIPQEILRLAGLKEGDKAILKVKNGKIVIRKLER